jgi:hypothetical protein
MVKLAPMKPMLAGTLELCCGIIIELDTLIYSVVILRD